MVDTNPAHPTLAKTHRPDVESDPMIPADDFYESLGAAIKVRRTALGMNQAELGKRLGLSRTSITNIERGRQRLLIDQFCRVAEVLNCDRDLLLAGLTSIVGQPRPRSKPNLEEMPTVARFVASLDREKDDAR